MAAELDALTFSTPRKVQVTCEDVPRIRYRRVPPVVWRSVPVIE